ncbi:hypothetical protein GCM10009819_08930 [Agromyces tropicus]|uniref:Uncharacterized protein n=1 Tax=Agromyces tropicus TaxID=555371 RepID=A0ABN2U4R6_9MICO
MNVYVANGCSGPDLKLCIKEANAFAAWYQVSGHTSVSRWQDGNVWGSDFRDGGGDLDPGGGADITEIYFYSGHGTCQNPPTSTSPDFISTCGNFGKPSRVDIGAECGFGNGSGTLQFLFLDASCPMDLVSITTNWFAPFAGLHMAVGHSGTSNADTLDSVDRGSQFGARTAGLPDPAGWLFPQQSVGDAWMATGTIDIQSGCSAVVVAAGRTESEAVDRREHERIDDHRADPDSTWIAWRWRTR